ncbi:hypothetical protein CWR43_12345 [Rhizobium sullae]|uniref:Uncharacterized protein n=1 Tax=Rhizobium sullae TaxID=50338 RepID=A0A2N0DCA5_RHISU|nr:hypothetical protein CWR43_12345 [Rhizobium sullae]
MSGRFAGVREILNKLAVAVINFEGRFLRLMHATFLTPWLEGRESRQTATDTNRFFGNCQDEP